MALMTTLGRVLAAGLAAMGSVVPSHAMAAGYPDKPVRMVVPFPPGGTTDIVARIVAQKMSDVWARQVVIDNRSGAGGSIGSDLVAKASPDGYTVLFGLQTTHAINPGVYKNLPFDPIKDFAAVTRVAVSPQLLALHPSVSANSLPAFIALAKASPGRLSYGSSGTGTSQHLAFEMFKRTAGVDVVHIPYKGTGPAIADLVGGHVQTLIGGVAGLLPHVKSGKLRAIAIASVNRSAVLPEVPTMAETLFPGFDVSPWFGLFLPAGTPAAITRQLYADVVSKVLNVPEVRQRIGDQGAEAAPSKSPGEFAAFVAEEKALWGKVIRDVMPAAQGGAGK
jgi:tripartite-type tricarboxylate transporter receptor subunit TctC